VTEATDSLRYEVGSEMHRLEAKLEESWSIIERLKLLLTKMKWVQEEEKLHEQKVRVFGTTITSKG